MSRNYKARGINLKGMPLGESDRLLTILTREYGLMQAIAPGARKHKSKLGGRSELFVVNDLVLYPGRSLSKIVQAETLTSHRGLSQHLGKLTASQYLAELVLYQALRGTPQPELFSLFTEHLERLEQAAPDDILARLAHGIFHLLALNGLTPQVQICCRTQRPLVPDLRDEGWRVGFCAAVGGAVTLGNVPTLAPDAPALDISFLNGVELHLLQQLAQPHLPSTLFTLQHPGWRVVERTLRRYVQHHLNRAIRSAPFLDLCFPTPPSPLDPHVPAER